MPAIKPVSDLRNYNEVLGDVSPGSPVFLTRNGRGAYAVVDIADYDRIQALQTLLHELEKGEQSARDEGTVSLDDMRAPYLDILGLADLNPNN